jgi:uncharacterized protein DUF2800
MSGALVVAEKTHSELGASVASRWMACPGSVQLARTVPTPPSTSYAEEGTRAHTLAELTLAKGVSADFFVGMTLHGGEVTDEMAEFVQVYLDHCGELYAIADDVWVERRFSLAALNPPGPMFGTADFVAYKRATRTLYVCDLKYGQGVVVEAKGNKQLRYYALGALLSLGPIEYPIDKIVMSIVQPRAAHVDGPIRSDEITYDDLVAFAIELMQAAHATLVPDAPLNPGSHCRFCPASGVCPAQRDHALSVAQAEFSVEEWAPPAPDTVPLAELVEMLPKFRILEDWMAACRALVVGRLERGEDVPGMKLVAKRPSRKFTDEAAVIAALEALGWQGDDYYVQKIKSPAQIEKLLGKPDFRQFVEQFVIKESSGYKLAPASDPAPAYVVTRGEEFPLLPRGEE